MPWTQDRILGRAACVELGLSDASRNLRTIHILKRKEKKKLGTLMDLATGERGGKTQYKPKVRNSKSVTPKEE